MISRGKALLLKMLNRDPPQYNNKEIGMWIKSFFDLRIFDIFVVAEFNAAGNFIKISRVEIIYNVYVLAF